MLRWVHDKHAEERPTAYGPSPSFLQERTGIDLGTNLHARRATEAFRTGKAQAIGLLSEYLDTLAKHLERLRITREQGKEFDDQVVESFATFKPYRDEFLDILAIAMRHTQDAALGDVLHHFFEEIFSYNEKPPEQSGQWYADAFDNFRLICRELFLLTNTLAFKLQRLDIADALLNRDYYITAIPGNTIYPYGVMARSVDSMVRRNQRLGSRRANLVADLLLERTAGTPISREEVIQTDFFLFLKATLGNDRWHPATHVYAGTMHKATEIFARATSMAYWKKVATLLSVGDVEKFKSDMVKMRDYGEGFDSVNVALLTNVGNLATRP
jgi:hypothetical protein